MLSIVIHLIHSYPTLPLEQQLVNQRYFLSGPLVLGLGIQQFFTLIADRDRTVSRRSKPSSRTILIGEQPNPWNFIRLQDMMSRHRGAKRSRRYELSESISLLSLAYLLSVQRQSFHSVQPDHYDQHKKNSISINFFLHFCSICQSYS